MPSGESVATITAEFGLDDSNFVQGLSQIPGKAQEAGISIDQIGHRASRLHGAVTNLSRGMQGDMQSLAWGANQLTRALAFGAVGAGIASVVGGIALLATVVYQFYDAHRKKQEEMLKGFRELETEREKMGRNQFADRHQLLNVEYQIAQLQGKGEGLEGEAFIENERKILALEQERLALKKAIEEQDRKTFEQSLEGLRNEEQRAAIGKRIAQEKAIERYMEFPPGSKAAEERDARVADMEGELRRLEKESDAKLTEQIRKSDAAERQRFGLSLDIMSGTEKAAALERRITEEKSRQVSFDREERDQQELIVIGLERELRNQNQINETIMEQREALMEQMDIAAEREKLEIKKQNQISFSTPADQWKKNIELTFAGDTEKQEAELHRRESVTIWLKMQEQLEKLNEKLGLSVR